jgi:vacuolar-type H+-ATPase subunit H
MTIDEILDEMENLLLESARVPFTNKRLVEEEALGQLMDELRENLPGELMEANRVLTERKQILEQAQKDAQNIVEQAKTYIHKLTDENTITRQAQEQANEVLQQARKTARDLQADSIAYADDVFSFLAENLEKSLEVLRQGRNSLHQTKSDGPI